MLRVLNTPYSRIIPVLHHHNILLGRSFLNEKEPITVFEVSFVSWHR